MYTKGKVLAGATLMVMAAASAQGQISDRKSLTLDGAKGVIAAAEAHARKVNAPGGVVAVVDDGGNLMALERLEGTFSAGANISIGKARSANAKLRTRLLINLKRSNTAIGKEARAAAEGFGVKIFNAEISQRVALPDAISAGKTIFDFAPKSAAANEYRNLTEEVMRCLRG